MPTLSDVMAPHGVEIPPHLAAQADVPLCTGLQRQGDVIVVPMREGRVAGLETIPAEGVAVVRGEAGGNTHLLVGTGSWAPHASAGAVQGTLVVPDGGGCYLIHPEHGATGMAPGTYLVSRQREQADVVRLIAD